MLRTVDFVETHDNRKRKLERFHQNELGLRHNALESVNDQHNAVYHLKDTLNLAAEISVARGVDDVDLSSFISNRCIFGKNRDTTLSLNIIRVHDTLLNLLVLTEHAALF